MSRLQQTQEKVEEVKVIMLDNLNKADERSGKLGELENRADSLLAKVNGKQEMKSNKSNSHTRALFNTIKATIHLTQLI